MKGSKYHNNKVLVDNIRFDSKKEANRFIALKNREQAGEIANLSLQKTYVLLDGFTLNGKKIRPITYKADFVYFDKIKNKLIIEDTKGFRTEAYKIKKKMFESRYGLEITEL